MMRLREWLGRTRLPVLADASLLSRVLLARHQYGVVLESRPGEFGSPIPDLHEVRAHDAAIFAVNDDVPAVDLNVAGQLALVDRFAALYADQPFDRVRRPGLRYYPENDFFGAGAAFTLHCMLRLHRPKRLIEVGSGFSSAVILDTNDRFLDGELACTFIDPHPERLTSLLRPSDRDRTTVLAKPIQEVELALFDELADGDVLFVDSSHVAKVGSDVNRLVFEVFPRLRPGVLVHLHDIYYPFEYPRAWIYEGRAWNENYLLRAFLMYNPEFAIVLFNSYLERFHRPTIAATMPLWADNVGTSLWLRRA
jgi:hypothetical protein